MRIIFRGDDIYMRDDKTNNELKITDLVNYLKRFDVWNGYEKVPDEYYHVWKILVLGSSEFDSTACKRIEMAVHFYSKKIGLTNK